MIVTPCLEVGGEGGNVDEEVVMTKMGSKRSCQVVGILNDWLRPAVDTWLQSLESWRQSLANLSSCLGLSALSGLRPTAIDTD